MKDSDTSIQERLKQVFDALGITIYQIAKDLDENSSKFYNILSGRAKPSYDTIIGILNHYPQIRADYLLRGEGPILNEGGYSNAHISMEEAAYVEVPFVPVKFHASFVESYTDSYRFQDLDTFRVNKDLVGNLRNPVILEVSGNSMSPQLVHGARVLATPVDTGDWIYLSGGVFAVIYRDFFVVKRIRENDLLTKHYLTLHSDNPIGGSVTVPSNEIRGIWRVANIVSAPVE
ncbi:MAG: LexA family transcriptional regulator [Bacteroidetes bacterium]|nr:LexA family transcriptional regulator [Bacteroidota bacterium]